MVKANPTLSLKYPDIHVRLVGEDGNAFAILGRVQRALRRGKVTDQDVKAFMREATAGDYNHLLATCMRWVNCDPGDDGTEDEE
jgi:hypothetical protein